MRDKQKTSASLLRQAESGHAIRIGKKWRNLTALGANTKLLKLSCRGSSLVERRPEKAGVASSILAPGTTQLCKRFFSEEVYLPIGFKADLPAF
jgi:hypothetical protein